MAPHVHEEASLCLVLSGEYQERIGGGSETHRGGHLLFCPAFESHSQTFGGGGALKLLVQPTQKALEFLAERISLQRPAFIRSPHVRLLGVQLVRETKATDYCSGMIIEGVIAELLGLLARERANSGTSPPRKVLAAQRYLSQGAGAELTVVEIAAAVGADPVTLPGQFKRAFGTTLGEAIRRARLGRAAELLAGSKQPIADIAASCGFYDQPHFTRAFKAAFATTPARFRTAAC
jgi:AraC family transcriptional regulator